MKDSQQDERHGRSSCVIRAQRLGGEAGGIGGVVTVVLLVEVSVDGLGGVVVVVEPLPLIVPLPLTVPPGCSAGRVVSVVVLVLVLVPGLPVVSSRRSQADSRPIATRTASEALVRIFMNKLLDTG
jgi:hypothetical protein